MKSLIKIFLVLSFSLLFIIKVFGQAAVDIPLIATDGTTTIPLAVGLDLTATNGIDPQLGESDLPPIPPVWVFEIRFDLEPYAGHPWSTYKDYRAPGNPPAFPFSGLKEHLLFWWYSTQNMQIDIAYNLPPGTFMTITDQIGGSFLNLGPFSGQGTATIPGTYTNVFNRALVKMEYDNIVPVELILFSASVLQLEKAVEVKWITATEINNSGFEIQKKKTEERSQELEWEKIGFVPGFGTTTELKSYSFLDDDVISGTYLYKLKQIDFDGSFEYSNEIEVEVDFTPKEFALYQNYPNPFNPTTTIEYQIPEQSFVTLKVFDVLGNEITTLINEEKPAGKYNVELRIDNIELSSGIYFYQLKAGRFIQTKKMILLK